MGSYTWETTVLLHRKEKNKKKQITIS